MLGSINTEIKRLTDESASEIAKLEAQRDDAKKRNWISTKEVGVNAINEKIAKTRDKYNGLISAEKANLSTYAGVASSDIDASKVIVKSDKGYVAFLSVVSTWLSGFEYISVTTETLEVLFFSMISIVFEIVAVMLFVVSQGGIEASSIKSSKSRKFVKLFNKENDKDLVTASLHNNIIDNNDNSDYNETKEEPRIIGFKPMKINSNDDKLQVGHVTTISKKESTSTNYSDEEVIRYINTMYDTANGNVSRGSAFIGEQIGIDKEKARKIKGHLEHRNIIETKGNRTFILVEKDEISN